jgi:hypothetical protein
VTPAGPSSSMNAFVQFTERFGNMISRILLTVLYYGLLGPFAVFYRLFADPLHLRKRRDGNWTAWTTHNDTLPAARKQD